MTCKQYEQDVILVASTETEMIRRNAYLMICRTMNGPYAAVNQREIVTLRQKVIPSNNSAITLWHFKQLLDFNATIYPYSGAFVSVTDRVAG